MFINFSSLLFNCCNPTSHTGSEFIEPRDGDEYFRDQEVPSNQGNVSHIFLGFLFNCCNAPKVTPEDPSGLDAIEIDKQLDNIHQFYRNPNNQTNHNDNPARARASNFIYNVLDNMCENMMYENMFIGGITDDTTIDEYTRHINKIEQISQISSDDSINTLLLFAKKLIKGELLKQFDDPKIRDENTVEIPEDELTEKLDSIYFTTFNENEAMYVLCTEKYPNGNRGENWYVYKLETARELLKTGTDPYTRKPITGFKKVVIVDPTTTSGGAEESL